MHMERVVDGFGENYGAERSTVGTLIQERDGDVWFWWREEAKLEGVCGHEGGRKIYRSLRFSRLRFGRALREQLWLRGFCLATPRARSCPFYFPMIYFTKHLESIRINRR
jgi:hypothetical protein